MNAVLGLYRLQQVDSQMDQIRARLAAIQETLQNDVQLRAATEELAATENGFRLAEREVKSREAEVQKQQLKIEQAETSLYGGHVHNPKELQDLQLDVASLKRHLETLEGRELEAMLAVENAEKELQSSKTKLEKVKSILSSQYVDLTKEGDLLQKETERLDSERKAIMIDILPSSIQSYEVLRRQKRGIAITTISDSACSACGTTLTPSQQQSARGVSQLFNCPTCGRILYAN